MRTINEKVKHLKQSGIRAASARCAELGGINLGQGMCDIPAHPAVKNAAKKAIDENKNLYAAHNGLQALREALAIKIKNFNHVNADPNTEILISHGSTGAYVSAVRTLFHEGDEIILFEPFYGYHKNICELFHLQVKSVPVSLKDFQIDFDLLEKTITPKTKAIVVCTPCNPSGKVFSKAELLKIGHLAKKHHLYVLTDEIYEYITYPGYEHVSLASLEDFKEFTITLSGFSKTYNVTGWRVGYAYGPAHIIEKMALVHDLLYICPTTPMQHAMIEALALDQSYYDKMRAMFLEKRDLCLTALREMGFVLPTPEGAYYLMADGCNLGLGDEVDLSHKILEEAKVAAVTGQAFFADPKKGKSIIRFCYALEMPKLQQALDNIRAIL